MIQFLNLYETNKYLQKEMEEAIHQVMVSGRYILGTALLDFEQAFALKCQSKHCIGVDNGTNAISLCLRVLGLSPGDEVIIPANSYLSVPLAIHHNNLKIVAVDQEPKTMNINVDLIEQCITSRTKVILITHMYGRVCAMSAIKALAKKYNLYVIDDCSHAHGATYKTKPAGSLADLSAFSFYPTKNLGAMGDAGAITTNNSKWAKKLRELRNYGFINKNIAHCKGYNCRMDEIQAAVLNVKLKYLNDIIRIKLFIAQRYLQEIRNPIIKLPESDMSSAWHLFVIRTKRRDRLIQHLMEHGIQSMVHYPVPFYQQQCFNEYSTNSFPVTSHYANEILSIPLHPVLKKEEVDHIIHTLNKYQ